MRAFVRVIVTRRSVSEFAIVRLGMTTAPRSRLQPLRGDPDNLLPEGKKATDKASTPKARSPRPARAKEYLCRFFHQREAHLRLPPPFCFFAPETSKPTPDTTATLVVTQSATAPHHCTAPLPTAPPCPTSRSPAAASTVQTC